MNIVLQALTNSLAIGGIYALLALGYSIIFSTMKMSHFAQGDIFMLGTFIAYTYFVTSKFPFAVALILALILTVVAMLVIERLAYRRMYNSPGIYLVMCTIGMGILLRSLAQVIWSGETFPFPSVFNDTPTKFGSIIIVPHNLWIIAISIVLMVVLNIFMTKTRTGIAMQAVSMNKNAAMLMGIKYERIITVTYLIAAVLATFAGVMVAPIYKVYATMGTRVGEKALTAAIMGGFGNVKGAMLGGLMLGILETFGGVYISTEYKDAFAFLILIVILLFKPQGILGGKKTTKV